MAIFLVERDFVDELELSREDVRLMSTYEAEHEVRWLTTFLSADKKKTYCLYEAEDVEIVKQHARDLGLPADVIVEVSELTR